MHESTSVRKASKLPATPGVSSGAARFLQAIEEADNSVRIQALSGRKTMSSEYDKKNEPNQGQKDDKSMGGRQGQNPQGGQREGGETPESRREGQGSQGQPVQGSQKKPSTGETESE
jgi:hypothetical protein